MPIFDAEAIEALARAGITLEDGRADVQRARELPGVAGRLLLVGQLAVYAAYRGTVFGRTDVIVTKAYLHESSD
jgi:hypothetical protein